MGKSEGNTRRKLIIANNEKEKKICLQKKSDIYDKWSELSAAAEFSIL